MTENTDGNEHQDPEEVCPKEGVPERTEVCIAKGEEQEQSGNKDADR